MTPPFDDPTRLHTTQLTTKSQSIEAVRARYRPQRIVTLFVGESAPEKGKFFYCGSTAMAGHLEPAIEGSGLSGTGDLRDRFVTYGWYLDDLVLEPIDQWSRRERAAAWRAAQGCLAHRIGDYRPQAIVSLLKCIKKIVKQAATDAGSDAEFFAVPFPGQGHQRRFCKEMAVILPKLPRHGERPP